MKRKLSARLGSFARRKLGIPPKLVHMEILGRPFIIRDDTFSTERDYDDAWLLACSFHSEVVFDVGANVGDSALLTLLSTSVKRIVLIEANPEALSIAAEHLVRNKLSSKAQFVTALAMDVDNSESTLWTVGTGSAGSIYPSHARTAAKLGSFMKVPTVRIDSICNLYQTVPDLVKIDVEGAEHKVLLGSACCAGYGKTRFLVEMHSSADLGMPQNAEQVLEWCDSVKYKAWYLAEGVQLSDARQVEHRGRCHLLLQPAEWNYPSWLTKIKQSDDLSAALPTNKQTEH